MEESGTLDRAVGIGYHVAPGPGTGGRLRSRPADFRVREIEAVDVEPVGADPGSYPYLVVRATLHGWDTNDFAGRLSDRLGMSRERVSWAGTKDKHAVTTQLFSLQGVDPGAAADAGDRINDAELTVVGRVGRPVLFGDLAGNEFRVVLRAPDRPGAVPAVTGALSAFADRGDPADLPGGDGDSRDGDGDPPGDDADGGAADRAAGDADGTGSPAAVEGETNGGSEARGDGYGQVAVGDGVAFDGRVGVPNWFGRQRFGSMRAVTHEVGLAVVAGDWEGAVLAYVGAPSDREPADSRRAREYVERTRDFSGALDRLPDRLGHERAICSALAGIADPGPEDYRRALTAVPTNLQRLFVNAAQSYLFNRVLARRMERGLPLGRPVVGDVVCFADRSAPADLTVPDADRTQRVTADRVDVVARHCERGRAFVTAPLVGTDTDFAGGDPGEVERAVCAAAGVEPADFEGPGEFGSSGTRRAALVRTDLAVERVGGPPDGGGNAGGADGDARGTDADARATGGDVGGADGTDRGGDGLALSFSLPRGSYATALTREFRPAGEGD